MTKTKATTKKHGKDAAMDEVLRRMLATPPTPITPPAAPKRSRKTVTKVRRQPKK
ncbi:MAG TPA: hypothetical protein VN693_03850 [Rhodanobacteraceae bacterium]|nr:hypothetical protein [Rhodanobacteraceae bacterium]